MGENVSERTHTTNPLIHAAKAETIHRKHTGVPACYTPFFLNEKKKSETKKGLSSLRVNINNTFFHVLHFAAI